MLELTFILIFLAVGAGCWFAGFWSNIITFICIVFAGMIATSLFEPLADQMDGSMTYLVDFIAIWLLFCVSFGFLRLFTELMSAYRVKFNIGLEMAGRSVFSILIAWVFISFSMFTLHLAPIEPEAFSGSFRTSESDNNFMGIGPGKVWLSFVKSRSRGAFSEIRDLGMLPEYDAELSADDEDTNSRVFDSDDSLLTRYQGRRENLSQMDDYLVDKDSE